MKTILIGAASSGCGKTTFTMGLLRALARRGLKVQPFKCGPDYIDPMFHRLATGTDSVNLDSVLSSPQHVTTLFQHYGAGADACVIEGAMGLFDGHDGPRGSAAELSTLLQVPVVLLVNARSVAYSVAPLIHGFRHFWTTLQLAGVVFNFVGSERHLSLLQRACRDAGVECFGFLPRNAQLTIPSRHLGLNTDLLQQTEELIELAAKEVEAHLDLERLLEVMESRQTRETNSGSNTTALSINHIRSIAVARDEAFNFTYRANLDALRSLAPIRYFSPLRDTALPTCDLLYLPGGYPELFASDLAANSSMRQSIRAFAEAGGHVLAECGGFMYLCQEIDGHAMCDVLPYQATMQDAHLHLGYREMTVGQTIIHGHEFHYSSVKPEVPFPLCRHINVKAGYTHWYWADDPAKLAALLDIQPSNNNQRT